jgi:hypothetical protein
MSKVASQEASQVGQAIAPRGLSTNLSSEQS